MYFYKLESMRGLACVVIVLAHSNLSFAEETLIPYGLYLALDFFFMLSGYVMCHSYAEKISKGIDFRSYIMPRFARGYPLHLITLLVWATYVLVKQIMFLNGFGGGDQWTYNNWPAFLANLTLTHALGALPELTFNYPSWSVSAEFFAYMAFFVVTITIDKNRRFLVPAIIVIVCYAICFSRGLALYDDLNYDIGFIKCVAGFFVGVILYRLRNFQKRPFSKNFIQRSELILVLAFFVCIFYTDKNFVTLVMTLGMWAMLLLVFTSESSGIVGKLLERKFLRTLGQRSYSIYMVHAIVLAVMQNFGEYVFDLDYSIPRGWYSTIYNTVALVISYVVSGYTYIHIEERFRRLYKERSRARAGRQAAVASVGKNSTSTYTNDSNTTAP